MDDQMLKSGQKEDKNRCGKPILWQLPSAEECHNGYYGMCYYSHNWAVGMR